MAAKQVLSKNIVNTVKLYAEFLRKEGIPYSRLIVFGSQAKGSAKTWSDIDVCVVSDKFGKDRHTERVRLMSVRDDALLAIEPHPYNPVDLQEKYDSLASEIRKYGITVV